MEKFEIFDSLIIRIYKMNGGRRPGAGILKMLNLDGSHCGLRWAAVRFSNRVCRTLAACGENPALSRSPCFSDVTASLNTNSSARLLPPKPLAFHRSRSV